MPSSQLRLVYPSFNVQSLLHVLIFFFLIIFHGSITVTAETHNSIVIGAIVDANSRTGKEEKTSMEIAVQDFNSASLEHNISLHFRAPGRDPFRTASAAEELIKQNGAQVIVGMHKWQEAALVAEIGVPLLSFAAPAISPPSAPIRWPFLMTIANDKLEQSKCISTILQSYHWRRVVVIYEDDILGGDFGVLALISEELQKVGSEIEYRMILPPVSSLPNPKWYVQQELIKVVNLVQSRVFIVLQSSESMVIHLFEEAKKIGFVGRDSAWIVTDNIANSLDYVNTSTIYSMEGTLGIKNYYSENTDSYKAFYYKFKKRFQSEHPEEDHFSPGFHALRAYDSIKIIIDAIERMTGVSTTSETLLKSMTLSNFSGLSGQISFKRGQLWESPKFRIVNVVGKRYKELDFWLPEHGFSSSLDKNGNGQNGMAGSVNWPGDLSLRNPRGWAMPTTGKPLKIGVPGDTTFDKFVKVNRENSTDKPYDGFCIELFYEALNRLEYELPFEFVPYYGTYPDLIEHVYNKTFDAVVGDITILESRTNLVEFTQPYAESGLSMIVPAKTRESLWLFLRPFTVQMWGVTAAILIYTMIIVSFLEHDNPEFGGPVKNMIGTAFWFTVSSLFFAHKEKLHSNLTRVVVAIWLFLVFILSSSYTASLSSMLTVQRLEAQITDLNFLKTRNLTVGCDGDSFVLDYLRDVLKFNDSNIRRVGSAENYRQEFKAGNIAAAFLELPYEKVFINQYCKEYFATEPTYRFGGFGFAFPRGSPMTRDFSKAILKIAEDGTLKELEAKWFQQSAECSTTNPTENQPDSLGIASFWGLYLTSAAVSTICLLLFAARKALHRDTSGADLTPVDNNLWKKAARLARNLCRKDGGAIIPVRTPTFRSARVGDAQWGSTLSSSWEYVSASENIEYSQGSSTGEIEMPATLDRSSTR